MPWAMVVGEEMLPRGIFRVIYLETFWRFSGGQLIEALKNIEEISGNFRQNLLKYSWGNYRKTS